MGKSKHRNKRKKRQNWKYVRKDSKMERISRMLIVGVLLASMLAGIAVSVASIEKASTPEEENKELQRQQLLAMGLPEAQVANMLGEATPSNAGSFTIDTYGFTDEQVSNIRESERAAEEEAYNSTLHVGSKVKVPANVKIGDKIELIPETTYDPYQEPEMSYPEYDPLEETTVEETTVAPVELPVEYQ